MQNNTKTNTNTQCKTVVLVKSYELYMWPEFNWHKQILNGSLKMYKGSKAVSICPVYTITNSANVIENAEEIYIPYI